MSNIKLSIIIPHYNYPKGLRRLLNTIPDNDEIQVIVVDDKSTKEVEDLSRLKDEYSNKNVEFYDNTWDKGAGNCRNIGMTKAKGDWYLFSDADDLFTKDFYDIVSPYFSKEYDIVIFSPTSVYEDTDEIAKRHEFFCKYYREYFKNPSRRNLIRAVFCPVSPCSKIIRASIVKDNNVTFGNTRVANDALFSVRAALSTDKYYISNETIYCITDRKGSLTTSYSEETLDIRRGVFTEKYNDLYKRLSRKDFNYLEMSGFKYYIFALKYGSGVKKFKELNESFKKAHVRRIYLPELWHMFTERIFKK